MEKDSMPVAPPQPIKLRRKRKSTKIVFFAIVGSLVLGTGAVMIFVSRLFSPAPTQGDTNLAMLETKYEKTKQAYLFSIMQIDTSKYPQNMGTLQKALIANAAELNKNIQRQRQDIKHPAYRRHEQIAIELSQINANNFLLWGDLGLSGELSIRDPETGKKIVLTINPHILKSIGLMQLVSLQFARDNIVGSIPSTDSDIVAIGGFQSQIRDDQAALLAAKGSVDPAKELKASTLFQEKLNSQARKRLGKPENVSNEEDKPVGEDKSAKSVKSNENKNKVSSRKK